MQPLGTILGAILGHSRSFLVVACVERAVNGVSSLSESQLVFVHEVYCIVLVYCSYCHKK